MEHQGTGGHEEYESNTLKLPEGYTIEPADGEQQGGQTVLVLKRADGSGVAAFEFSALGPGPRRIWEIAWDDVEYASTPGGRHGQGAGQ